MSPSYISIHFPIALLLVLSAGCRQNPTGPEPIDEALTPAAVTVTRLSFRLVKVEWQDSTANRTGFLVERAITSYDFTQIAATPASVLSLIDTVKIFGLYTYRVRTLTKNDTSLARYSSSADIHDPNPGPAVLSRPDPGHLLLQWQDYTSVETGFVIERDIDSTGFVVLAQTAPSATSCTDTIRGYFTYAYRVHAVDGTNSSDTAATPSYTVTGPIPTEVQASYFDQEYLGLSWIADIPFATGLVVEKSIDAGPFVLIQAPPPASTSTVDTARAFGTYRYRIYAVAGTSRSDGTESNVLEVTHWLPGREMTHLGGYAHVLQLHNADILAYSTRNCQRYEYASRQWHMTGSLSANAAPGVGVVLHNGSVLNVAGGIGIETPGGVSDWVNEIFDPNAESWRTIADMQTPFPGWPTVIPVVLPNGSVFLPGTVTDDQSTPAAFFPLAEEFSSASETFTVRRSGAPIQWFTATLLSNGKILTAGGVSYSVSQNPIPTDSCLLYNPSLDAWSGTGFMTERRMDHWAFPFQNNNVVVVFGGRSDYYPVYTASYERYDVSSQLWASLGTLPEPYMYAAVKVADDTLYALLGDLYSASGFYRYTYSGNSWQYVESWPSSRTGYPISLHRLPNGRFIALGNGTTNPEFYIPSLP